jgi:UDP-2,4-diacetamido-2,4,6-trideoxy-beta-L-altropyranose hydrolase
MMRVLIRADASVHIGTGHVMRCLALAHELRRRGSYCAWWMRPLQGHLMDEVARQGFDVFDADAVRAPGAGWDWLVADHYGLDATWHQAVRPLARRLMAVDDLADRPLDCELLLDQNLQAPGRYDARVPAAAVRLLGPRYALLRAEFSQLRAAPPARAQPARVLVSFGGADEHGVVLDAVAALQRCGLRGARVQVIAGARNPHWERLQAMCLPLGYECLPSTDRMAQLMAQAALAVGAGGTTMVERFALGLPSVVVPIADNQRPGSLAALAAGAIVLVDTAPGDRVDAIAAAVGPLLDDPQRLAALATASAQLCDGQGTARVAQWMQQIVLDLHGAVLADAQRLLDWRNAPQTRAHSGDGACITLDNHMRWLTGVLRDPARGLWIAALGDTPVGVVRFDTAQDAATVSVYLVPGMQGRGWGRAVIAAGVQRAMTVWPALERIDARISPDNPASLHAFSACGFEPGREPGIHHLILRSPPA